MRLPCLLFMLSSCALETRATLINAPPAPMVARAPANVEVFSSGMPTRPHVDVALLQVEPSGIADDSTVNLVRTMRAKAAGLGCDAVVITQLDAHIVKQGSVQTLAGTCIVWTR
jgi:hypothetical protein